LECLLLIGALACYALWIIGMTAKYAGYRVEYGSKRKVATALSNEAWVDKRHATCKPCGRADKKSRRGDWFWIGTATDMQQKVSQKPASEDSSAGGQRNHIDCRQADA
jgi:hypothetical protein